jgi:hypothetical protein
MIFSTLLIPALASIAYAESTVTSMFIYGADEQPLAASIVGNVGSSPRSSPYYSREKLGILTVDRQDQTATTYSINCPPGTDSNDCGMGPGMTVVAGKDVTSWIFDDGPALYAADLPFFPSISPPLVPCILTFSLQPIYSHLHSQKLQSNLHRERGRSRREFPGCLDDHDDCGFHACDYHCGIGY